MRVWAAFLKSVNVGGRNLLPMAELRALAEGLGWHDVRTYVQSGNCVFRTAEECRREPLAVALSDAIARAKGFRPPVAVFSVEELAGFVARNPFEIDPAEDNKLHLHLPLAGPLSLDVAAAEALRAPSEALALVDGILYLHAPDGIGRSKLFAGLPRLLSGEATVRNLRTVAKVRDLALAD